MFKTCSREGSLIQGNAFVYNWSALCRFSTAPAFHFNTVYRTHSGGKLFWVFCGEDEAETETERQNPRSCQSTSPPSYLLCHATSHSPPLSKSFRMLLYTVTGDSPSECIAPRFCPSFPPSMTDCTSKWEEEPYQADCVAWIVHTVRSRIIYSPTSSVANLLQLSWSQGMGVFYIDICGIHIVLLVFLPWYVAGCSRARVARHHQGALFCLVIKQQLCLLSTRQQQSRVGCSWWNFWQYAKYRSCQP